MTLPSPFFPFLGGCYESQSIQFCFPALPSSYPHTDSISELTLPFTCWRLQMSPSYQLLPQTVGSI